MTCTEPNYGPKVSWSDGRPVAPRSEPLRDAYYSRVRGVGAEVVLRRHGRGGDEGVMFDRGVTWYVDRELG